MSFESGFRLGQASYQQGIDNDRRARLDAQAAEEHQLRMRGLRREQDRLDRVDTATRNYEGLLSAGGLSDTDRASLGTRYGIDPSQVNTGMTGFGIPYAPDTPEANLPKISPELMGRRGLTTARQRIAAAAGDFRGMAAGEAEQRQLNVEEDMAANLARINDPAFREELARNINQRNKYITINEPTKDKSGKATGPYSVSIIGADGKSAVNELSDTDFQKLTYAYTLTKRGKFDDAMNVLTSVNADIADAVKRSNELTGSMAQRNEQGRHNFALEGIEDRKAGAAEARASRMEHLSKLGMVRQYKDPVTGKITEMYPEVTRGGIQWKPVPIPTGMEPYQPKMQMSYKDQLEAYVKLRNAGEDEESAWAKATNVDQWAKLDSLLGAKPKEGANGGKPRTVIARPQPPANAVYGTPQYDDYQLRTMLGAQSPVPAMGIVPPDWSRFRSEGR